MMRKNLLAILMLMTIIMTSCERDMAMESPSSSEATIGKLTRTDYKATVSGNISNEYEYSNVPIGGGGYVTGIVIHPLDTDIKYIRTDVGGAYKWDAKEEMWLPITDFFSNKESIMYGIDGIAIDPNNKDIVYLCCGDGGGSGYITPAVYKSTNRGETFERTSLSATFLGNANHRQDGECIMVDPNNSDVIYCGTRREGLMVSYDGAKTWEKILSIPENAEDNRGVRSVAVDTSSTENGRSKKVYVALPSIQGKDGGVYESTDGGIMFRKVEGIPTMVRRISVSDGVLYATTEDGVYKYKNGKVTDISPKSDKRTYRALATSGNKVIVCHANTGANDCMNMNIYYSTDGGLSWTQKNNNIKKIDKLEWWPDYYFSSATASLLFSPDNDKEVWFTDWYSVWMTPNIEAKGTIEWHLKVKGHEEAVVTDILSNKEGPVELVTAMVDNGGMFYKDVTQFPKARRSGNSTGLDFCEENPRYVVLSENDNAGTTGMVQISTDYGQTFTKCKGWSGTAMRIAQNCSDFRNFVVLPINGVPKYTTDSGKTWHDSEGAPNNILTSFWGSPKPLCSDRVAAGVYYLAAQGSFYRSLDGGKTWEATCYVGDKAGYPRAVPGKAGHVAVCAGGNLYYSDDYGANFKIIRGVEATTISFGVSKDKKGVVTYILGTIEGKTGLFRSEDLKTFVQLNDEETNKLGKAGTVVADRREYGRVFMTTGGRGIIVANYKD